MYAAIQQHMEVKFVLYSHNNTIYIYEPYHRNKSAKIQTFDEVVELIIRQQQQEQS